MGFVDDCRDPETYLLDGFSIRNSGRQCILEFDDEIETLDKLIGICKEFCDEEGVFTRDVNIEGFEEIKSGAEVASVTYFGEDSDHFHRLNYSAFRDLHFEKEITGVRKYEFENKSD